LDEIATLRDELSEDAERQSDRGRSHSDALVQYEGRLLTVADTAGRRKDMTMAISRRDYGKVMSLLGEFEDELRHAA